MQNPAQVLTPSRVADIFSKAYLPVSNCRMELAMSGFAATGIFPFNRNIFTPEDFIADNENSQQNESIENIHEAIEVSDVGKTSSSDSNSNTTSSNKCRKLDQ